MKYVTDVQTIELGKIEQTSKAGKAGWGGAGDRRVRTIAKVLAPRWVKPQKHTQQSASWHGHTEEHAKAYTEK